MQRTKIVATIGPGSSSPAIIRAMIEAGASVFRLNFSHGRADDHANAISTLRAAEKFLRRDIMILGDLPGPKIRLGEFAPSPLFLEDGQPFFLTPKTIKGNAHGATVNYPRLLHDVQAGDHITLNDGAVLLTVKQVAADRLNCIVENGGEIATRKGVSFPGVRLKTHAFTANDRKWMKFALEEKIDALAVSFVRTPEDLAMARKALKSSGQSLPLIAKIEKHEAVEHLEEIIYLSDAVMVARGDLGVELPLELVPRIQKDVIRLCNRLARPVITATQMLESMIHAARPTRAEVSDVANAILDGSDAIMLSAETAVGEHPVDAVASMARTAIEAEKMLPQIAWIHDFAGCEGECPDEALGHSVFRIAERIGAAAILCLTSSGSTARRIARYRPAIPLLAVTADPQTRRWMQLVWGVQCMGRLDVRQDAEKIIAQSLKEMKSQGLIQAGQKIVAAAGIPLNRAGNTNLIRVIEA